MVSISALRSFANGEISALNEAKILYGRSIHTEELPPFIIDRITSKLREAGVPEEEIEEIRNIAASGSYDASKNVSLSQRDIIQGILTTEIEKYDVEKDILALASDNIVEIYNCQIATKYDEAIDCINRLEEVMKKYGKTYEDMCDLNPNDINNDALIKELTEIYAPIRPSIIRVADIVTEIMMNDISSLISKDDIRRWVTDCYFETSDNPEIVKNILQLRVNYNNSMTILFRQMLKINYASLGFSKEQADSMIRNISSGDKTARTASITELKAAVKSRENQYRKENILDLRSLGAGVIMFQMEETGLDDYIGADRLLQLSLKWDCIIIGHGGVRTPMDKTVNKIQAKLDKSYENYNKRIEEFRAIETQFQDSHHVKRNRMFKRQKEISNEIKKIRNEIDLAFDMFQKEVDRIGYEYNSGKISYEEFCRQMDQCKERHHEYLDKLEKARDKLYVLYDKIGDSYYKKYGADGRNSERIADELRNKYNARNNEWAKEAEMLRKELSRARMDLNREHMDYERDPNGKKDARWVIPDGIKALNGEIYTDVNELIRELIREGFKKIYIMSCNPGHAQLADDIKRTKGVIIHMSQDTLIVENAYLPRHTFMSEDVSPIITAEINMDYVEMDLMENCKYLGISYDNDQILEESYQQVVSGEYNISLNEGALSRAWSMIVNIAKKVLQAIVYIFKKIVAFVRAIIDAIKELFRKAARGSFSSSINTRYIMVESAYIQAKPATNWKELEKQILESCNTISNKIRMVEADQTKITKQTAQFAEQRAKAVNEASGYKLKLMRMYANGEINNL